VSQAVLGSRLLVCLTLALAGIAEAEPAARPRALPFLRGVSLGEHSNIDDTTLTNKLNELRWLGASHATIVISWSTPDVTSTTIAPRPGATTPDPVLERMIRRARALGLKVFLFPILDVQNRKAQEWRGALRPKDWEAWWQSYRRFILHYAALSRRAGVELFAVGSELVTTEGMTLRWKLLIESVRKTYRGKLVYSANWDHYAPVTFWNLVDVVGLTAYYKVADRVGASEAEMASAWRGIRAKLLAWSRKIRRPFIFTEVGYPSLTGCAIYPWDYTRQTAVNLEEQRRAYATFIQTWRGVKELQGVFFWDWYGDGGQGDRSYTPRGKPAEKLVREWYIAIH
jgi:hypothetical protein